MTLITETVDVPTGHTIHVERHVEGTGRQVAILVNGALSTTDSFRQTVKYLAPDFDVVLYDLPFYGKSAPHNPAGGLLHSADEVGILRGLIDRYQVDHVASISWGGLAALLVLSDRPASIRSATIGSFSPLINPAMLAYITSAQECLESDDCSGAATLLNDTVGRYLPRLLRTYNHRYISNLTAAQRRQTIFHIRQMRSLPIDDYLERLRRIEVPVLFVNGEHDDYTTADDIRSLGTYVRAARFETIPEAGHFLDLENKRTWERMRSLVTGFMQESSPGVEAMESSLRLPSLESTALQAAAADFTSCGY